MSRVTTTLCFIGVLAGCATTQPPAASNASELNDPNRPQPMTETGVPQNDATQLRVTEGPTEEPSTKTAIAQTPQPGTVKTTTPPPPAGATQPPPTAATQPATASGAAARPAADNTINNRADQPGTKPTPFDQSNSESDLKITAAIRRALMDEDSLSFGAKNTKIVTNGGNVVLRGAVNSAAEKTVIESRARQVAGANHVTSELEVAK